MSFCWISNCCRPSKTHANNTAKCDLSYFNKTNSELTLVSRFLADVGALSRGVHNVIINIVKDSLTFIFLLGVMFIMIQN